MVEYWIVGLALLGFIDSLYTAIQQIHNVFEFCFTKDFVRVGCYDILHSEWASIFWVPNSWLGTAAYALLSFMYWKPEWIPLSLDLVHWIGAGIATLGLAMSYYLVYVQHEKLEKYCIFCLTSTLLMTIIFVLSWSLVL